MASAAALYTASLMLLGVLLGRIILKEEITWLAIVALTICLCGISLILFGLSKTILTASHESQHQLTAANQTVPTTNQNQPSLFSHASVNISSGIWLASRVLGFPLPIKVMNGVNGRSLMGRSKNNEATQNTFASLFLE